MIKPEKSLKIQKCPKYPKKAKRAGREGIPGIDDRKFFGWSPIIDLQETIKTQKSNKHNITFNVYISW